MGLAGRPAASEPRRDLDAARDPATGALLCHITGGRMPSSSR